MEDFRETLYTIDNRGNRRWVYPSEILGYFGSKRRIVAAILLLIYVLLPWIQIAGQQAVLIDILNRKFIFFGQIFWATDTRFLLLALLTLALSLFFFTAIFGRIWCGWACPETVFLEFVFRPIEILIEGNATARLRLDQSPWNFHKIRIKALKYLVFSVVSWYLASTVLAYFIGREELLIMMTDYPWNNLSTYLLTLAMMFVLLFQFGWFREQFCTVICPYARFQSVLLDDSSLLVGYDPRRGEPRGKVSDKNAGDCIDCGLCVRVCPTGIDIRNGLQMECIQCAQCIDACDSIMTRVNRPLGLIRYDTERGLSGNKTNLLRPRVVFYGLIFLLLICSFAYSLATRELSEAQILHGKDELFSLLADGRVTNRLELRLVNKASESRSYTVSIPDFPQMDVVVPLSPFPIAAGSYATLPIFVKFDRTLLEKGKVNVVMLIKDEKSFRKILRLELIGPG